MKHPLIRTIACAAATALLIVVLTEVAMIPYWRWLLLCILRGHFLIRRGRIAFIDRRLELMSTGVIQGNQTTISASLSFQPAGAAPASPPTWSMSVAGVLNMTVAADGMSAQFTRATDGNGTTDVNVIAEGDATPGVDRISLTGTIQVLAKEITSGEIDFGPAS